jgi:hypothetical protein
VGEAGLGVGYSFKFVTEEVARDWNKSQVRVVNRWGVSGGGGGGRVRGREGADSIDRLTPHFYHHPWTYCVCTGAPDGVAAGGKPRVGRLQR